VAPADSGETKLHEASEAVLPIGLVCAHTHLCGTSAAQHPDLGRPHTVSLHMPANGL
jgi:hypothetical protein